MPKDLARDLYNAVIDASIANVKDLLSTGASTTCIDEYGNGCLHHAMWNGYYEIVRLLLEHGADINAKNGRGETPLAFVRGLGIFTGRYKRCLAVYIEYEQSQSIKKWFAALHEQNVTKIKELLSFANQKFYQNLRDDKGNNALHILVLQNPTPQNQQIFAFIHQNLDTKKMFAMSNHNGQTLLHVAAEEARWHWVSESIKQLKSAPATDSYQYQYALYYAICKSAPIEIIEQLLAHKAPLTAVSVNNETLLHLAILKQNLDVINLLLFHGINTALVDRYGQSAIDLAINKQYAEIFNAFSDKDKAKALAKAIVTGDEAAVAFILSTNLNKSIHILNDALFAAAAKNDLQALKVLLASVDGTYFTTGESADKNSLLIGELLYTIVTHPHLPKKAIQVLAKHGNNKEVIFQYIKTLNAFIQSNILEKVCHLPIGEMPLHYPLRVFFNEPRGWLNVSSGRGLQQQIHKYLKTLNPFAPVAAVANISATCPALPADTPLEGTVSFRKAAYY